MQPLTLIAPSVNGEEVKWDPAGTQLMGGSQRLAGYHPMWALGPGKQFPYHLTMPPEYHCTHPLCFEMKKMGSEKPRKLPRRPQHGRGEAGLELRPGGYLPARPLSPSPLPPHREAQVGAGGRSPRGSCREALPLEMRPASLRR